MIIGPCPRKEKHEKLWVYISQAAHGPFGHICATQMRKWCHFLTSTTHITNIINHHLPHHRREHKLSIPRQDSMPAGQWIARRLRCTKLSPVIETIQRRKAPRSTRFDCLASRKPTQSCHERERRSDPWGTARSTPGRS